MVMACICVICVIQDTIIRNGIVHACMILGMRTGFFTAKSRGIK